jgi:hypothetical protein
MKFSWWIRKLNFCDQMVIGLNPLWVSIFLFGLQFYIYSINNIVLGITSYFNIVSFYIYATWPLIFMSSAQTDMATLVIFNWWNDININIEECGS